MKKTIPLKIFQEAVKSTEKALEKENINAITAAWNKLDKIFFEDLSQVGYKEIDTAVDIFQAAGVYLCEKSIKKRK